jgi:hypothetical protein
MGGNVTYGECRHLCGVVTFGDVPGDAADQESWVGVRQHPD